MLVVHDSSLSCVGCMTLRVVSSLIPSDFSAKQKQISLLVMEKRYFVDAKFFRALRTPIAPFVCDAPNKCSTISSHNNHVIQQHEVYTCLYIIFSQLYDPAENAEWIASPSSGVTASSSISSAQAATSAPIPHSSTRSSSEKFSLAKQTIYFWLPPWTVVSFFCISMNRSYFVTRW